MPEKDTNMEKQQQSEKRAGTESVANRDPLPPTRKMRRNTKGITETKDPDRDATDKRK